MFVSEIIKSRSFLLFQTIRAQRKRKREYTSGNKIFHTFSVIANGENFIARCYFSWLNFNSNNLVLESNLENEQKIKSWKNCSAKHNKCFAKQIWFVRFNICWSKEIFFIIKKKKIACISSFVLLTKTADRSSLSVRLNSCIG